MSLSFAIAVIMVLGGSYFSFDSSRCIVRALRKYDSTSAFILGILLAVSLTALVGGMTALVASPAVIIVSIAFGAIMAILMGSRKAMRLLQMM